MANYANLKAQLDANIFQNDQSAITGAIMNAQLKAMVDALGAGYQYMGVATPSTDPGTPDQTPDQKVFYLASQPGTYTNFPDSSSNAIVVNDGEVCALIYSTSWSKQVTGAATVQYKSYNYTKNDYTNSLVKEIHIDGERNPDLRYFVRSCKRYYNSPDYQNFMYFAIQSYNPTTEERITICEFGIGVILKSGIFSQKRGNYTTTIYVTIDNQNSNVGCVDAVPYSEQYEINDNCWGDIENCPILKLFEDVIHQNVVDDNTPAKGIEVGYNLTDGYWSSSGIAPSPGFYCTDDLFPVQKGTIVKTIGFFKPNTPGGLAAAYMYDKNRAAVGDRINISNFTYSQEDNSYSYTIQNNSAAFIGLSTMQQSTGQIILIYPTLIKNIYVEQIIAPINIRLSVIESQLGIGQKHVDVIMFMGQSNMAGRGIVNSAHPEAAPVVPLNIGYEFRPISDPTKLYPIVEPFGVNENNPDGINDGTAKTGSMVSAFVNAYFTTSHKIIVGVSASKGGTTTSQWLPSGTLLQDAIQRLQSCVSFLASNGYIIDHKYMVWCQGESDGDTGVSAETYKSNFRTILNAMKQVGIELCFLVRIGKYNGQGQTDYSAIIGAQSELCKDNADIIMASTALASFKDKGLMKDEFHYYQDGYNLIGTYAGRNAGLYRLYRIGKPQYDVMTNDLFITNKDY